MFATIYCNGLVVFDPPSALRTLRDMDFILGLIGSNYAFETPG